MPNDARFPPWPRLPQLPPLPRIDFEFPSVPFEEPKPVKSKREVLGEYDRDTQEGMTRARFEDSYVHIIARSTNRTWSAVAGQIGSMTRGFLHAVCLQDKNAVHSMAVLLGIHNFNPTNYKALCVGAAQEFETDDELRLRLGDPKRTAMGIASQRAHQRNLRDHELKRPKNYEGGETWVPEGPIVLESARQQAMLAQRADLERSLHDCYGEERCHADCPAHEMYLERVARGGSGRPIRDVPPGFTPGYKVPRYVAKVLDESAPFKGRNEEMARACSEQLHQPIGHTTKGEPVYGQDRKVIGVALCEPTEDGMIEVLFGGVPAPSAPISLERNPMHTAHKVAVPCKREGCGHVTEHALGSLDPKEGACAHSFQLDQCRGRMGMFVCTNCLIAIGLEVLMDAGIDMRNRYDAKGNALADEAQKNRDAVRELSVENSMLRRKIEKLERKPAKR